MIIYENHSPFPHLQALCAERGIEKHSLSQVFQDLGIQFDLEGNDVLNIRLNRTVWPGRYLERGFLTAEIEAFEPKIKSWLKSGLSFGKTGEEEDQDIPVKDAHPKPAPNPTESSDPIRHSLDVLSSSVFPLQWQTLLTRLLTSGRGNGMVFYIKSISGSEKTRNSSKRSSKKDGHPEMFLGAMVKNPETVMTVWDLSFSWRIKQSNPSPMNS